MLVAQAGAVYTLGKFRLSVSLVQSFSTAGPRLQDVLTLTAAVSFGKSDTGA